jgi:hydroxymethylpyrimidine/phosphomethylpyrimidine kinase
MFSYGGIFRMKVVLSVAGSDSSGGAGIQADIKTITAHKLYAQTVITALTAQNTTGVFGIYESTPEFVTAQLDANFGDIPPDAVKIGMVSNIDIIRAIAEGLKKHNAKNIVLDPVMVATSGGKLMRDDAAKSLMEFLFPLATVITPNIPEAEALLGTAITNKAEMEQAAISLSHAFGISVLVKGGHLKDAGDDVLAENNSVHWFEHEAIVTENTHGTGCTLSTAIACGLAQGLLLKDAVASAKAYVTGALLAGLNLGKGNGPLNHMWNLA